MQKLTSTLATNTIHSLQQTTRSMATILHAVSNHFTMNSLFVDPFTGSFRIIEKVTEHPHSFYVGIDKDALKNVEEHEFVHLRASLLEKMGLHPDANTVQVIGDSAYFSPEGTRKASEKLHHLLGSENDSAILYGYTGRDDKERADINGLVSRWIDEEPQLRAKRVIANVVDKHSLLAMTAWDGVTVNTNISQFTLVTGEALFGDDVHLTDQLTKSAICLEGGVQSFRQIVNFLSRDVVTRGIYGLRPEYVYNEQHLFFFSAGEFFHLLQNYVVQNPTAEVSEIIQMKDKYLEERLLYSPSRPDGGTKQKLFDEGWEQFLQQRLWKKLPTLIDMEQTPYPNVKIWDPP